MPPYPDMESDELYESFIGNLPYYDNFISNGSHALSPFPSSSIVPCFFSEMGSSGSHPWTFGTYVTGPSRETPFMTEYGPFPTTSNYGTDAQTLGIHPSDPTDLLTDQEPPTHIPRTVSLQGGLTLPLTLTRFLVNANAQQQKETQLTPRAPHATNSHSRSQRGTAGTFYFPVDTALSFEIERQLKLAPLDLSAGISKCRRLVYVPHGEWHMSGMHNPELNPTLHTRSSSLASWFNTHDSNSFIDMNIARTSTSETTGIMVDSATLSSKGVHVGDDAQMVEKSSGWTESHLRRSGQQDIWCVRATIVNYTIRGFKFELFVSKERISGHPWITWSYSKEKSDASLAIALKHHNKFNILSAREGFNYNEQEGLIAALQDQFGSRWDRWQAGWWSWKANGGTEKRNQYDREKQKRKPTRRRKPLPQELHAQGNARRGQNLTS